MALGTALVASITKDNKHRDLTRKITDFLLTLQDKSGVFLSDAEPADKYYQSAELGVWMREIDTYLSD